MDIFSKLGFSPVEWRDDHISILDQRQLPLREEYLELKTIDDVAGAIYSLAVRGAPLIGIVAAYGLCLLPDPEDERSLDEACRKLKSVRPTAVNLPWAVDRMAERWRKERGRSDVRKAMSEEASRIHSEDRDMCARIGAFGNEIVPDSCRILTHCNAGALATGGIGTALGVIYAAFFSGKKVEAWVDETRPVLQGARLTAWELARAGVPFKLIPDNAAGYLMSTNKIDLVITGADRVAKNLDLANKIGTYGVAVLARNHDIPFYVAAPSSTFDQACPDGASINVELRDGSEVTSLAGQPVASPGTEAFNPAFDITPHHLVSGIITENGILRGQV
jgi:methylthioribose-1-phosphate isomerase